MKDIQTHLWDVFVYLGVGALALLVALGYIALIDRPLFWQITASVKDAPTSIHVFALPVCLTLFGALFEPVANSFEKVVLKIPKSNYLFPNCAEYPTGMEEFVKSKYTERILGAQSSPYHFCKEFVQSKNLSSTFMPFLAKFGFYRSVATLFFVQFVCVAAAAMCGRIAADVAAIIAPITLLLTWVYLARSRQFYSFQAPAVYAAFLGQEIR